MHVLRGSSVGKSMTVHQLAPELELHVASLHLCHMTCIRVTQVQMREGRRTNVEDVQGNNCLQEM